MSEKQNCSPKNSSNIPNSTSHYYKTVNLPRRFECPALFRGYGIERDNSIYYTANSEYGKFPPSVHTVPLRYYPQSHQFSHLMLTTKRRAFTLNGN